MKKWECCDCGWKDEEMNLGWVLVYEALKVTPEEVEDPEETTEACPKCQSINVQHCHI